MFRKGFGLRLTAIVSLALGLGPAIVAFGALDRLLFRPLPFREPERLVQIHVFVNADPRLPQAFLPGMIADEIVQRRDLFDGVGWITGASLLDVSPSQDSQPLRLTSMSSNGLDVLGVTPVQGRAFVEGDADDPLSRIVLLTHDAWTREFGGSPDTVGRSWQDGRFSYRIVGILPRGFLVPSSRLMGKIDGLVAVSAHLDARRGALGSAPFARLARGVTLAQAESAVNLMPKVHWEASAARVAPDYRLRVEPLRTGMALLVPGQVFVLAAGMGIVLLLSSVNVSVLMVVLGLGEQRETAIRRMLGESGGRVVRRICAEAAVLCGSGTLLAWGFAAAGYGAVLAAVPGFLQVFAVPVFDPRVLAAIACSWAVACVSVAVVPISSAWCVDLVAVAAGRLGGRRARRRFVDALIAAQAGLAVAALGIGLTVLPGAMSLMTFSFGHDVASLYLVDVYHNLAEGREGADATRVRTAVMALSGVPGVRAAAAALYSPLDALPDQESEGFWQGVGRVGRTRPVGEGYFEAVGIEVLEGRTFTAAEVDSSAPVAMLDREGAKTLGDTWRVGGTVGRQIRTKSGMKTIIGVVERIGVGSTEAAIPTLYLPITSDDAVLRQTALPMVVRMKSGQGLGTARATAALNAVFPRNAARVHSLEEVLAPQLGAARMAVAILGTLAVVALVLAAVGVFAVARFEAVTRRHELAIRAAVGANRAALRLTTLGFVVRPVAIGVGAGVLLCWWFASALLGPGVAELLGAASVAAATLAVVGVAVVAAITAAQPVVGGNPLDGLRQKGDV